MSIFCLASIFFLTAMAVSQDAQSEPNAPPANLVPPHPGSPICVQQVDERTRNLKDNSAVEITQSRICRNSLGTLRIETFTTSGVPSKIVIVDPKNTSAIVLIPSEKLAYRVGAPKGGGQSFIGLTGMGEALPEGNWKTSERSSLGRRVFNGFEFEGSRTTQTSENPAMTAIYESWYSKAIDLTALAEAFGPNWRHTARITAINRAEPDNSEFVIPPEYEVHEIGK